MDLYTYEQLISEVTPIVKTRNGLF